MQTDGFREENGVIYLTQLTDLSGNGNHAVQDTATAQAYLDGSDAVFSGGQWYENLNFGASGLSDLTVAESVLWKNLTIKDYSYSNITFTDTYIDDTSLQIRQHFASGNKLQVYDGVVAAFSDNSLIENNDYNIICSLNQSVTKCTINGVSEINSTDIPVLRGSKTLIGSNSTKRNHIFGTISTIAIYAKTLTTHEQAVVNQCLNILGA
jgi:hypothetical protein